MAWSGFMILHPFAVMIYGKLLHEKKRVEKNEKLCLELIIIMEVFNFSVIQITKRTIVHWFISINFPTELHNNFWLR